MSLLRFAASHGCVKLRCPSNHPSLSLVLSMIHGDMSPGTSVTGSHTFFGRWELVSGSSAFRRFRLFAYAAAMVGGT
jgi:hypothetical protein